MTLIPGLTVIRKPFQNYLAVRENGDDRELTATECWELWHAAETHPELLAAARKAVDAWGCGAQMDPALRQLQVAVLKTEVAR